MNRPERSSRMAWSTGSPANARAVISNSPPGSPSSTNRPFFVPTTSSVMWVSTSRDRGKHVDPVLGTDRRLLAAAFSVDEYVDVPADESALVEDPAVDRGLRLLQPNHQVPHRGARHVVLGSIAGELLQRSPKAHDCHD